MGDSRTMASSEAIDYYEILGVSRTASPETLKRSYRQLARRYHPDVNPGSGETHERFRRIQKAYEILSKEETRRKYDRLG